ncbi:kti12, chromatin associated [Irineochytrium annulatum]|nr:kti12, chromatin associated [Irineochytrium annulatum]
MPLVVMCGFPCSGKTRRATQLKSMLEEAIRIHNDAILNPPPPPPGTRPAKSSSTSPTLMKPEVVLINEESLHISRAESYADATGEKKLRGALLSAVERHLTNDTVVILDSMNYIKGFRYQLFCVAKEARTTQCTYHCLVQNDTAVRWNSERDASTAYPPDIMHSLLPRFEEPDSRNRWDNPLFSSLPDEESPSPDLVATLLTAKPFQPNLSVALKPVAETNYLHEMDSAVRAVGDAVMGCVREGRVGDVVVVAGCDVKVRIPGRGVSVAEMGRLKKGYVGSLTKLDARLDEARLKNGFAEYLNANLR